MATGAPFEIEGINGVVAVADPVTKEVKFSVAAPSNTEASTILLATDSEAINPNIGDKVLTPRTFKIAYDYWKNQPVGR